jgi:hypothetical protein
MNVRFFSTSLLLSLIVTSFDNVCIAAQVNTAPQSTTSSTINATQSAPKKNDEAEFKPIPFHAKYKISLDKDSSFDESITEVNGTLEMTVEEKDDVFVSQQKSVLYIYYKGKEAADKYDLTIASYESKNGQAYEFCVRSMVNDEVDDEIVFKGDAKLLEAQQGYAQLKRKEANLEEQKLITLPKGTIFPLKQLYVLVQEAMKGNMAVGHQKVFDGSSESQEVVDVDAYITPKNNYKMNINSDADATNPAALELAERLKNAKAWQIKMNVFPLESRDDVDPEYTYTQTVNSLGVPVSMKIKYPDPEFTVNIVMTDFGKPRLIAGSSFEQKPTEQ